MVYNRKGLETMNFVEPKTYLIGVTSLDLVALNQYLVETDQKEFFKEINDAVEEGISTGEILCSFYAKMCYKALTNKHNKNVTQTRSITKNLINCFETGHHSVFEHCNFNFVTTNCSRVFTHELVRHRLASYSQTSGRYVRSDSIDLVFDPVLEPVRGKVEGLLADIECVYKEMEAILINDSLTMTEKKQITSAMRRILPNGQANEIGWSVNIRQLRHMIQLRTNRVAEREIRLVINQVVEILRIKYPGILYGAEYLETDGFYEVTFP